MTENETQDMYLEMSADEALAHVDGKIAEDKYAVPWPLVVLARELRRLRAAVQASREIESPDWIAPTGQRLQVGASYRASISYLDSKPASERSPVLRRVGMTETFELGQTRQELKKVQRENGRLGNELGRLRIENEALRGRNIWQTVRPLAAALGFDERYPSLERVIEAAVAAVRSSQEFEPYVDGDRPPAGVNDVLYANAYSAETRRIIEQDAKLAARRAYSPQRFTHAVQATVVEPKGILEKSWLNEPRFANFLKAYRYAASHFSLAAHAFAKVMPEDAYWIWATVDKGLARNVRLEEEKRREETANDT